MSAHEGSAAQAQWLSGQKTPDMLEIEAKVKAEKARTAAEATEKDAPDPLNDELQAMRSVARVIEKLDEAARLRVMAWLTGRYLPGPMTLRMEPEPWRR